MFVTLRAIRDVMHAVNTTALTNAFVLGIPFLKKTTTKKIPGINFKVSRLLNCGKVYVAKTKRNFQEDKIAEHDCRDVMGAWTLYC